MVSELSTTVGFVSSIALGLGVLAMLSLVYIGYKQDKEEESGTGDRNESEGETAA